MLVDWSVAEIMGYHEEKPGYSDTKEIPEQHRLKDMLPIL